MSSVASRIQNVCFSWNGRCALSATKRTLRPRNRACLSRMRAVHSYSSCLSLVCAHEGLLCLCAPQIDTRYQDDNKIELVLASNDFVDGTRCQ